MGVPSANERDLGKRGDLEGIVGGSVDALGMRRDFRSSTGGAPNSGELFMRSPKSPLRSRLLRVRLLENLGLREDEEEEEADDDRRFSGSWEVVSIGLLLLCESGVSGMRTLRALELARAMGGCLRRAAKVRRGRLEVHVVTVGLALSNSQSNTSSEPAMGVPSFSPNSELIAK